MADTANQATSSEEEAVPNVHAEAFAERQRDPARYEDPTISTPGVLEDVEGDAGPHALVSEEDDPTVDRPLDPSVDNRSEVQPMLDTLQADALRQREAAGMKTPDALEGTGSGADTTPAPSAERAAAAKEGSAEAAEQRSDAPMSDISGSDTSTADTTTSDTSTADETPPPSTTEA